MRCGPPLCITSTDLWSLNGRIIRTGAFAWTSRCYCWFLNSMNLVVVEYYYVSFKKIPFKLSHSSANSSGEIERQWARCATYADCRLQTGRLYIVLPIPSNLNNLTEVLVWLTAALVWLTEVLVWLTEVLVWLAQARVCKSAVYICRTPQWARFINIAIRRDRL